MPNFGTSGFVIIARIDFFHCCIRDHHSENQTYHLLHQSHLSRPTQTHATHQHTASISRTMLSDSLRLLLCYAPMTIPLITVIWMEVTIWSLLRVLSIISDVSEIYDFEVKVLLMVEARKVKPSCGVHKWDLSLHSTSQWEEVDSVTMAAFGMRLHLLLIVYRGRTQRERPDMSGMMLPFALVSERTVELVRCFLTVFGMSCLRSEPVCQNWCFSAADSMSEDLDGEKTCWKVFPLRHFIDP